MKWLRRRRLRTGARLLPFVDGFVVFASSFDEAMRRKDETFPLVDSLGLNIHLTKGYRTNELNKMLYPASLCT